MESFCSGWDFVNLLIFSHVNFLFLHRVLAHTISNSLPAPCTACQPTLSTFPKCSLSFLPILTKLTSLPVSSLASPGITPLGLSSTPLWICVSLQRVKVLLSTYVALMHPMSSMSSLTKRSHLSSWPLNFSNLSTLSCWSFGLYRNTNVWVEFIQRHHMTLRSLDIDADLPLRFWETLADTSFFPELREVSIDGYFWGRGEPARSSFQDESAAAFWKACTRFKAVSLSNLYPELPDMDCRLTFKYLESLKSTQLLNPTIAEFMVLLSNCPRLQYLSWERDTDDTHLMCHGILEGMAQLALSGHLQNLRSLDLNL
ncbi:MAG: hypothetical protein JOS17DRAFT_748993 [Linnemannia elongata]|nr:MAG: hypothetical protein JOS17DRAFT_748993 [Linnemannia elongata]